MLLPAGPSHWPQIGMSNVPILCSHSRSKIPGQVPIALRTHLKCLLMAHEVLTAWAHADLNFTSLHFLLQSHQLSGPCGGSPLDPIPSQAVHSTRYPSFCSTAWTSLGFLPPPVAFSLHSPGSSFSWELLFLCILVYLALCVV